MHKQYWLFLRSLRHGAVPMGPRLVPLEPTDYTYGGAHVGLRINHKTGVYYFGVSFYILRVGTFMTYDQLSSSHVHAHEAADLKIQAELPCLYSSLVREFCTQHHLKRSDSRPSICLIVPTYKLADKSAHVLLILLHHQTR